VLLSAQLLLVTAVLHRFAALQTTVAVNLMALAFIAAAIAGLGGIAALVQIWRNGWSGTAAAAGALFLGAGLLIIPTYYLPVIMRGGGGFDASTNPAHPPVFQARGTVRRSAGVDPALPPVGSAGTDLILEPVLTTRSPSDVFDLANDMMRQLDLNIVAEEAPGFGAADGTIEATDRTFVLGLVDDIAIRISVEGGQTRIDIRSAARYPRLDLGRNAERVQLIARKLRASIDTSVPTEPAAADTAGDQAGAKPVGGSSAPATALRHKKRGLAQPGAPRAQAPIVELR
jgi:uncharacterized protein (DUF1499 family)